ncbi:hypothetical protein ACFS7Z_15580 [Pontibacter toksunensis]|uniref:PEGA domain-containing protein n=1 Tax=Pontibacter toksunensis TaxID=1332631 RepID=A0ABW6BXV4_9BACT
MKRNLILILLTLLLQNAFAQDYIVKVNGEEIPARVLEITLEEILYHQPDSSAEVVLRLPKTEVFMVRFENGAKEVFSENLQDNKVVTAAALTPDQLYLLGKRDAIQLYKGEGVLWGSAASALIFPYGLAGSAVLAFTPPNVHQNRVSDRELLSYPDYVKGYKDQAKKRKIGKAAAGAGIGTLVGIAATVAIILSTWQ